MDNLKTPYDEVTFLRVLMFLSLLIVINLIVLMLVYPIFLEIDYGPKMVQETKKMEQFYGWELYSRILFRGDSFYDWLFVTSGFERSAYEYILMLDNPASLKHFSAMEKYGPMLDNIFNYCLTMCYRLSGIMVLGSLGIFLMLAIVFDSLIRRERKRYQFGDSSILINIWSRGTFVILFPIAIIIIQLPIPVHPLLIALSVLILAFSMTSFLLSVPKIA